MSLRAESEVADGGRDAPAVVRPRRPSREFAGVERDAAIPLGADEVTVWIARLDEQPREAEHALAGLLSADEVERGRRFYFERDRRRFATGRGILRTLIGRYAGIDPRAVRFAYGANGKPAWCAPGVASAKRPPIEPVAMLHFNLSHAEGLAVFAFTRTGEIGVDIECERELPEWETIAATYFAPHEQARLQACAVAGRRREFFRAWTRQEAVLKARGIGLGGAVGRGATFGQRASGGPPPVAAAGEEFALAALEPAEGFAGALAIGRAVRRATSFNWPPDDACAGGAACRGRPIPITHTTAGPDSP